MPQLLCIFTGFRLHPTRGSACGKQRTQHPSAKTPARPLGRARCWTAPQGSGGRYAQPPGS
eukprot:3722369-Pyramimonas_sp.AAC.1